MEEKEELIQEFLESQQDNIHIGGSMVEKEQLIPYLEQFYEFLNQNKNGTKD